MKCLNINFLSQSQISFTTAVVLNLSDFTKTFIIELEASKSGIGSILLQNNHPISFFGKKLSIKLSKSSTYLKELYIITEAICKSRQYLLGNEFVIRTNHKNLHELQTQVIKKLLINNNIFESS